MPTFFEKGRYLFEKRSASSQQRFIKPISKDDIPPTSEEGIRITPSRSDKSFFFDKNSLLKGKHSTTGVPTTTTDG
jgi:hypothetical protein